MPLEKLLEARSVDIPAHVAARRVTPLPEVDGGVIRSVAGPGEVRRDVARFGPQIEVAGDEATAIVDPDRLRLTILSADPFGRLNQVFLA